MKTDGAHIERNPDGPDDWVDRLIGSNGVWILKVYGHTKEECEHRMQLCAGVLMEDDRRLDPEYQN